MSLDDWIYTTDRRRQRVITLVLVVAVAAAAALLPFIERHLYPPFGSAWPWVGGPPPDYGFQAGLFVFLLFAVLGLTFCLAVEYWIRRR